MEENGGWPKLGYYLGVFLEWLRKTTKILSLNRGSGCRCEPRTTQILKHACCHSTWHLWYASAYITRGSPICSSPRRYFQRCCPSGEYPRLLQKGSCPYLYPRRYNQAAIMSWSATLFQQCMWALPGSCHHVTNTGRNIRRWLWRLCSWGLGGGRSQYATWPDPTHGINFIAVPWPFLSYEALRQSCRNVRQAIFRLSSHIRSVSTHHFFLDSKWRFQRLGASHFVSLGKVRLAGPFDSNGAGSEVQCHVMGKRSC